ncbi:MAG: hypothetical protein DRQ44_10070 [Gammaproteobacteria bacterium]|nr:MAG: hypothetical protein DRQ44_10070 [Gammaproteobacteria bacterium]
MAVNKYLDFLESSSYNNNDGFILAKYRRKQMTVIKLMLFGFIFIMGALFFTLYQNDANLLHEPGIVKRMAVFLTTNTAATADDHVFKELRTPVFNANAERLYQRVIYAASELGWDIIASDSDNQNANMVAHSRLFLFEDGIFVQVKLVDMEHSSLYIQSRSRTGYADFASNSGNIQALINKIKQ